MRDGWMKVTEGNVTLTFNEQILENQLTSLYLKHIVHCRPLHCTCSPNVQAHTHTQTHNYLHSATDTHSRNEYLLTHTLVFKTHMPLDVEC